MKATDILVLGGMTLFAGLATILMFGAILNDGLNSTERDIRYEIKWGKPLPWRKAIHSTDF